MPRSDSSTRWSDDAAARVVAALHARAAPRAAATMAAYMRDQFAFLGVAAPAREAAWREVRAAADERWGRPDGDELVRLAELLWREPHRELRYVAAKALAAGASRLDASHLPVVRRLLTTDAWWDTVDILAPDVVGSLARASPGRVVPVLDRWVVDDDLWLVRSAVLHQLRAKQDTDVERLARHCSVAAPHPDVFVRKAVGWALRQYSYVDPDWVESFVARTDLHPLSRREARRAIERRRRS